MNWAWQFRSSDAEEWKQFDCTDCIQLEFNFKAYSVKKEEGTQKVLVIAGEVDFETLQLNDHSHNFIGQVRRSDSNIRSRPNADRRHNPV